jgi:hypothetical protein
MFLNQARLDLIIEDGSHNPVHQSMALLDGMRALRSGGIYILEDIHTSHPAYMRKSDPRVQQYPGTSLSVLLGIDHYKRIGVGIDEPRTQLIAAGSILRPEDVNYLASSIASIALYRRTHLPDRCYRCGSSDYDFTGYRCRCGVEIFSDCDSMSFVIMKS